MIEHFGSIRVFSIVFFYRCGLNLNNYQDRGMLSLPGMPGGLIHLCSQDGYVSLVGKREPTQLTQLIYPSYNTAIIVALPVFAAMT